MSAGRILVTGAGGYLGGRVWRHLAASGDFAGVRLATRRAPADRPAHVEVAAVGDLDSDAALSAACRDVSAIVHLAAPNEVESQRDPARAVDVTVRGTVRLLAAAAREGVRRVVYFSTAHVYGAPLVGRLDERTLPRPVHPYAITHRAAEDFVLAAGARGPLEAVVIRLSNAIGAPAEPSVDRWTLVANDLCRQAVQQRELRLLSPGLQPRDFIAMSDVCRAVAHFLLLPRQQLADGVFNVGAGETCTVLALATLIAERCEATLGFRPPVLAPPPPPGAAAETLDYSIEKLRATGFAPAGDLAAEIDDTLRLCLAAAADAAPAEPAAAARGTSALA